MLKTISLFAGIGGFELGFEKTKQFEIVTQVEINDFCRRILRKHWPDTPKLGDITQISPNDLPACDVILAGFPCQPHSVAGEKRSTDDERWLWEEIETIIKAKKPRYVVLENVRGLLTTNGGEGFRVVMRTLFNFGYDAQWGTLRARDFGYPHRRERLFFVAYPSGIRLQRHFAQKIQRKPAFSWWADCRSVQDLRNRPDIPEPLIWGTDNGVRYRVDRTRAIGNAIVPDVAKHVAEFVLYIEEVRLGVRYSICE